MDVVECDSVKTFRPVPLWTTGTLSSPVKLLMSNLLGSLQRCLLCFGRSTKHGNGLGPDWRRPISQEEDHQSNRQFLGAGCTNRMCKEGKGLHEDMWEGPRCNLDSVRATRPDCWPPRPCQSSLAEGDSESRSVKATLVGRRVGHKETERVRKWRRKQRSGWWPQVDPAREVT